MPDGKVPAKPPKISMKDLDGRIKALEQDKIKVDYGYKQRMEINRYTKNELTKRGRNKRLQYEV